MPEITLTDALVAEREAAERLLAEEQFLAEIRTAWDAAETAATKTRALIRAQEARVAAASDEAKATYELVRSLRDPDDV